MLTKQEKDLIEKVVTGGGATGQSMTADPTGSVAQAPGNSKKQGDSMPKLNDPSGTGIEETDPENNVKPTGDNSAQNKASVAMKGSAVKEQFAALFGEGTDPEFVEKATAIVEGAIAMAKAEMEDSYAAALEEEVARITETLTEQVDQYLTFAASEWLAENEVAIESSLKNELTEEFIEGLKNLFAEHYIEVPAAKVDVMEALASKVTELESKLNEEINDKIALRNQIAGFEMERAFSEVAEGMVLSNVEKFRTIAENLEYPGDVSAYKAKLETIKENYFSGKVKTTSNILTEGFDGETEIVKPAVTGEMSQYVTAISKTIKK